MSIRNRASHEAIPSSPIRGWLATLLAMAGVISAPTLSLAAAPPVEGSISVEARVADGGQDAASDIFRDAAAGALSSRGFTLLDGAGHAAYRMELIIRVSEVGTGSARVAPTSPDVMTGGVAGAVGSVLKVPVPSRKSRLVALERTQLDMILRKRGEEEVVWRGTAVTVRPAETQAKVASDLCNALLRAYPSQSDETIGVP
ncbi:hypothetical protein [Sphingobium sp.]|uniref:hypothetical protein n=1 Tax=Sphingobium sp. TaxID=1912891 RepID=UPI002B8552E3|nr:hypothetical protein [Sphingobium sp.]HUD93815.1 hypothetical protein [Sphingobium sp.]